MELQNEHSVVEALYRLNTLNQGHILRKLGSKIFGVEGYFNAGSFRPF